MSDKIKAKDQTDASIIRNSKGKEELKLKGYFTYSCYDKDGNLKWTDDSKNTVVTVGANFLLDATFATAAIVGPFLGILTATTAPVISTADTMTAAGHAGWLEAGNANAPALQSARPTAVFAAASARTKVMTTAAVTASGAGTAKGSFLVLNTGAVSTIDSTAGTLFSAGAFSGGDKLLATGDTLQVTYQLSC